MITVIIIFAVAILLILAVAAFAVVAINKSGTGSKNFEISEDKANQWSNMASQYDAGKGREDRIQDRETYDSVSEVCIRIKSELKTGISTPVKLDSIDAVTKFDPESYLRDMSDRSEMEDLLAASDERVAAWKKNRTEIDWMCVLSHDTADPLCRRVCDELIDAVYESLSPDPAFECKYTGENGRMFSQVKRLPRNALLKLLGRTPEMAPGPDADIRFRRKELERAGFRCERCGRSPLTGATLRVAGGPNKYEVLCERCGER